MKRKKLLCAAALTLLLALTGALLWSIHDAKGRFTVLEYHDFTDDPAKTTDYTMTMDALRRDLDWLRDKGYVTILPRELAAGQCDDGSPLPEKAVMLTFDDGYASNYTLAFPILQEYGAKAAYRVDYVDEVRQEWLEGVLRALRRDDHRQLEHGGLLDGTGRSFRKLRVSGPETLADPRLADLLRAARAERLRALDRT